MNNIEACRQPARDVWKPVWRRGGEKLKVKREKKDSGVNTNADNVYLLCVESEERRGDVGEPELKIRCAA